MSPRFPRKYMIENVGESNHIAYSARALLLIDTSSVLYLRALAEHVTKGVYDSTPRDPSQDVQSCPSRVSPHIYLYSVDRM